jgi:hypothetical protein
MEKEEKNKNKSMGFINDFIEKNVSVLTLIAVFIGIASFILDLNRFQKDDSIILGAIGLIFLIGLLLAYLSYIALLTIYHPLIHSKSDEITPTIQILFVTIFMACLISSYIALISYFFVNYSNLTNWFLISMILLFTLFFGIWFVASLFTYFKTKENVIKSTLFLFAFLDFLVFFPFRNSILKFLSDFFSGYGQATFLYCIIISFLSFGAFYFYFRKK